MKVSVEFSALNYLKSASVILTMACFGLPQQLHAQKPDVVVKANQNVDYTLAVNELLKLGFPNAKDAKYMKLSSSNLSYTTGLFNDNIGEPKGLTGNVFFLPAKGKSKDRVILLGGGEYPYTKSRSGRGMSGPLKSADLKKDLKTVATWIRELSVSDGDWDYYSTERCAVAFGFANLAYHTGHKKEATELFKAIFLSHENPEKLIDSVINGLATTEYNRLYVAFNEKGNWQDYLKGLQQIQKKFPRGWRNQPGLEILIPQVKLRAENKAIVYPSIAGHTFKPEIMKLIKSAYDPKSKGRNSYPDNLFLINKPKKQLGASPFVALTSHNMDGFIAIVAMIGDETLVTSGGERYDHYGMKQSYSNRSDDGISPEVAYQSLTRPSTVGSLASSFVRSVLPHPRETLREMGSTELRRLAIEWWKKHRNDSTFELTKHYLKLGNENHAALLSASLLKQNTKESLQLLVDSILSSDTPSEYQEIVKKYAAKQRKEAKDFIKKYEVVLRKEIGEGKDDDYTTNGQYYIKEMGGTTKYIAKLNRYTEPLDPALLLNTLSRKQAKTNEILEQLVEAYQGKDISNKMGKFIYAIAKSDTYKRKQILSALVSITYPDEEVKPLPKPAKPSFSKYEKEDIQTILGLKEYVWFNNMEMSGSLAIQFSMVLDKVYNPSRALSDYSFISYLNEEESSQIIFSRMNALIAGEKMEPLPDTDAVKPERLDAITKLLEKSDPSTMRKIFKTFSLVERVVLAEQEADNDDGVFSKGNKYIQGVVIDNKDTRNETVVKVLQPLLGTEFSAKGLETVCEFIHKNHNELAGSIVHIDHDVYRPGLDLYIELDDYREDPKLDTLNKKILDGKIEAYTAIITYDDENISKMVVFGDKSEVDANLITQIIEEELDKFMIVTNNKANLENQIEMRKKTLPERLKIIKAIIKINPEHKKNEESLKAFKLDALKVWHDRVKKRHEAKQKALEESSEDGSSTDGFILPGIE